MNIFDRKMTRADFGKRRKREGGLSSGKRRQEAIEADDWKDTQVGYHGHPHGPMKKGPSGPARPGIWKRTRVMKAIMRSMRVGTKEISNG